MLRAEALYEAADVLGMTLEIELDKDNKERITGSLEKPVNILPWSIDLPVDVKIISSFVSKTQVGFLMHVTGDLLVMMCLERKATKKLFLVLFNKSQMRKAYKGPDRLFERFEVKDFEGAGKLLKDAYIVTFTKAEGAPWEKFHNP